jgi:hypothetical protein
MTRCANATGAGMTALHLHQQFSTWINELPEVRS